MGRARRREGANFKDLNAFSHPRSAPAYCTFLTRLDLSPRSGIAVLTVRELFDFAVDPSINESNIDAALERLMEVATSRPIGSLAEEAQLADRVFAQVCLFRARLLGAL